MRTQTHLFFLDFVSRAPHPSSESLWFERHYELCIVPCCPLLVSLLLSILSMSYIIAMCFYPCSILREGRLSDHGGVWWKLPQAVAECGKWSHGKWRVPGQCTRSACIDFFLAGSNQPQLPHCRRPTSARKAPYGLHVMPSNQHGPVTVHAYL